MTSRNKRQKNKSLFPCHEPELSRLNRVAGQVEGIKKMITERRYCADILTQIRAVRAALKTIEAHVLETHLRHCVHDALQSGDSATAMRKLDELKGMLKRYDD